MTNPTDTTEIKPLAAALLAAHDALLAADAAYNEIECSDACAALPNAPHLDDCAAGLARRALDAAQVAFDAALVAWRDSDELREYSVADDCARWEIQSCPSQIADDLQSEADSYDWADESQHRWLELRASAMLPWGEIDGDEWQIRETYSYEGEEPRCGHEDGHEWEDYRGPYSRGAGVAVGEVCAYCAIVRWTVTNVQRNGRIVGDEVSYEIDDDDAQRHVERQRARAASLGSKDGVEDADEHPDAPEDADWIEGARNAWAHAERKVGDAYAEAYYEAYQEAAARRIREIRAERDESEVA